MLIQPGGPPPCPWVQAPIMIGCDLSLPLCKSALPLFLNKEMLAISQDDLGVQVRLFRLTGRTDLMVMFLFYLSCD